MSLPYAVLGLLAEGPKSGYELVRQFDYARSVIWPAPQNEIYRELAKLLKAGAIVEDEDQGPRGRRRYRIEEEGRRRLKEWLLTEEADFTLRYEPILRAVFFGLLGEAEMRRRLEADLPFYREQVSVLEKAELGAAATLKDDPRRFGRRQALGLYRALRDWSEDCLSLADRDGPGQSWKIEEAREEDAVEIAMLGAQVFLDTYAPKGIGKALATFCAREFTEKKFLSRLRQKGRHILLARGAEGVLAYADLELGERTELSPSKAQAELSQLYVSRHAAHRGLGRALLQRVSDLARAQGAELLWLSAYHGNTNALAFYRKQGFTDIGAVDFLLEDERHENRVLSKSL